MISFVFFFLNIFFLYSFKSFDLISDSLAFLVFLDGICFCWYGIWPAIGRVILIDTICECHVTK